MKSFPRNGLTWLLPGLAFLFLIDIFPLLYAMGMSLHSWWIGDPEGLRFVGWQNYLTLLTDPALRRSIWVSTVFMISAVLLEFMAGLGLALFFAQHSRVLDLVRPVILLPLFVTPVVSATMWRLMIHPDLGIVNYYLRQIGIGSPSWLGDPLLAMTALVLLDAWRTIPFMFLVLHAGVISIPGELFEAAAVDGASAWQSFRHITLPLLQYIILVAVLIRAMDAFREFDIIYVVTAGGPGTATETLQLLNYRIFGLGHMGMASTLSTLTLVMVALMCFVLIRLLGQRS